MIWFWTWCQAWQRVKGYNLLWYTYEIWWTTILYDWYRLKLILNKMVVHNVEKYSVSFKCWLSTQRHCTVNTIPELFCESSCLSLYLEWIEEQQSPGNSEGGRQWQQPPVRRYRADKWLISHRDRGKVSGSTVAEWNAKSSSSLFLNHTLGKAPVCCADIQALYYVIYYIILYWGLWWFYTAVQ